MYEWQNTELTNPLATPNYEMSDKGIMYEWELTRQR